MVPFFSVCGHEPDGAAQEMAKWDRDAVLEELGNLWMEGGRLWDVIGHRRSMTPFMPEAEACLFQLPRSGKTSVLVQRLLQRLTDPLHPVAADRLLVVTFTKAAAAEMKSRITKEIGALLEQEPDNIHLQRQQILLNRAHISTIHSFCSELVRENFYKLGISPDFRILEENETLLLRQEVITAVLDGYYEKRDGLFYELADTFSVGRDDGRIAQMVQLLYDFTRSHPFPDRWLSETARSYSTAAPVEKTPWGKTVLNFAGQAVDYCCSLVKNSLELMEASPDIQAAYEEAYLSDLAGLLDIEKAIKAENWNLLVELCGDFSTKIKIAERRRRIRYGLL
ncbi:MAG: UvrD-helicase domain-containing protein [Hydrogeniiclostridium mannosilyticum]